MDYFTTLSVGKLAILNLGVLHRVHYAISSPELARELQVP